MNVMRERNAKGATLLFVVLGASLLGCSGSKTETEDTPKEPEKKKESPVENIGVKSPAVTIESADGTASYVLRAKESAVHMTGDGPSVSTMRNVEGEINRVGQEPVHFTAPEAKIDRESETLSLHGGVSVTGIMKDKRSKEVRKVDLKAKTVRYFQGPKRIEADGDVTVTSNGMVMGPLPKLWANEDFTKIATPGKFKP